MKRYLYEKGLPLCERGYHVLPVPFSSKECLLPGWSNVFATAKDISKWVSNGHANSAVGINARFTPVADADILDESIADEMWTWLGERFPGFNLLVRTGRRPKFLVPFRLEGEPFRKISSKVYTDGSNEHKFEILADGTQWIAYNQHPDTGKPYTWWDGVSDEGIASVAHSDLPPMSAETGAEIVAAFDAIAARMVDAGKWKLKASKPSTSPKAAPSDFDVYVDPVGKSESEVAVLLGGHANDDADYDHWFQVLAAVHHELGDAGREIAHDWSSTSAKHREEKFELTWGSLGRYTGRQVTLRSLLKGVKPTPKLPDGATEADPFPFYPGDEYARGFENVSEMVEDLLPDQGTGMVYGASQSGKTFWAMDIAFHVHNGDKWRDREVKRGPVFYIAAEAGRGIRKRIAAYKAVHPASVAPFFADTAPDLLDLTWVKRIRDSIMLRGGASLVVIDTMSASFTGDDSSQQETAVMVQNCSNLAKSLECLVLFVHHSKKDGASWRGSGVLYNDNDVVIEISADGEDEARTHCAHVVKQRDDEAGQKFGFRLIKSGKLGEKPNGKPITSCTIEQTDDKPVKKTGKKSGGSDFENNPQYGQARHYLDILTDLAGLGNAAVEEAVFVHAVQNDETVNPESEPDYPKPSNIRRSLLRLAARGKVSVEGRWIRLLA
jgi:hypothetical protein